MSLGLNVKSPARPGAPRGACRRGRWQWLAGLWPACWALANAGAQPRLAEDRLRLPAGLPPAVDVLLADVDGDGRIDLVRVAVGSVAVLLQDPAGRFAPHPSQVPLIFAGAVLQGAAFGHIRGLGVLPDLVLTRAAQAPLVLLNNNGVFAPAGFVLPPPPTPVAGVLVGDLDHLPPDDIVVLPSQGRPQLLLGQLAGYRDASQLVAASVFLQSPRGALFDLDGDADLDVLFASAAGAAPYLLENTGQLMRQIPLPVAGAYSAVATADFDGDGRTDIALARTAPLPIEIEFVLNRVGGWISYRPASALPLDQPATRLRAVDVQGDGSIDLVALQSDGLVRVGLSDGRPNFSFSHPTLSMESAPRGGLAVADLDSDGDADMVVAGGAVGLATVRDSVLLGDARTSSWFDTEAVGFPVGLLSGGGAGAAVDLDGDAELDVVVYTPTGRGVAYRNDGTARFSELAGVVPALPMRDVRRVLRASIDAPERDLVVVSGLAGGVAMPPGLRLLVNQAGRYTDVTAARLPPLVQRGFADVAVGRVLLPASGTRRVDDLLLADAAGNLIALVNQAGNLGEIVGAFAPSVAVAAVRALLIGDVDGDSRPDVVVVEHGATGGALQVYLRTATNVPPLFVLAQPPALAFGAVTRAVLADMDGDGDLDIVASLESGAAAPLLLLAGDGVGGFRDATATVFPPLLPAQVDVLAVLPGSRPSPSLLVGENAGERLILLRRIGTAYTSEEQPIHGSTRVTDFVVADFDGDGDDDCAVLAAGVRPGLLLGTDVHLAGAVAQGGHTVALLARGPDPTAIAALLWSAVGFARLPFPGLGVIRLAAPIQSLAVFPIGPRYFQELAFQAPRVSGDLTLYFQLAVFDARVAQLSLSNLAPALILSR